jgi:hypothetical protein
MKRLVPVFALLGLLAGLAGASAAQANGHGGGSGSGGGKNFTCTNQGGGPDHTVYCGGILNGNTVNVNVGDVNVLSGDQLSVLENSLDNEVIIVKDLDVVTQVKDIDLDVVTVYLTHFNIPILISKVKTCVGVVFCG